MADLVIRGIELPKERSLWLCIKTDGTVYNIKPGGIRTAQAVGTVIPLPEGHGKLGDLDKLYAIANERSMGIYGPVNYMCVITGDDILKAPTIIPAEGGPDE